MTLTVGSLFAGVGGMDLGLERAGLRVLWQVEIDDQCRSVLARHWPNVTQYADVREVTGDQLPTVDVLCGGFPCQDVSVAGRRAGLDGERSGLWWEFWRLIHELRPTWVVIENVPGLLSDRSDDIEHRCVCGWSDRRRGVHLRSGLQTKEAGTSELLSGRASRDDGKGSTCAALVEEPLRRTDLQDAGSDRDLGRSVQLARLSRTRGRNAATTDPLPDSQRCTGTYGDSRPGDPSLTHSTEQEQRCMDGGRDGTLPADKESHSRTEPEGSPNPFPSASQCAERATTCPACGRRMGDVPNRPVLRHGMGTVLWSLATLGYGFAWRCLDARYFGLAQRRQRVFIVGRAGGDGASAAQVLLEPERSGWGVAPRRAPWPEVAETTADSVGSGGCAIDGCGKSIKCRGLCANHYERLRTRGTTDPYKWPERMECAVPGCLRRTQKRGWCNTHYQRWRMTGDVRSTEPIDSRLGPNPPQTAITDQFWSNVDLQPRSCWRWRGSPSSNGYGRFYDGTGEVLAHRYAYELAVGPIPDGLQIDHLCRNRICVRPDHLQPVTAAENIRRGWAARAGEWSPDLSGTLGASASGGRRDDLDLNGAYIPVTYGLSTQGESGSGVWSEELAPAVTGSHGDGMVAYALTARNRRRNGTDETFLAVQANQRGEARTGSVVGALESRPSGKQLNGVLTDVGVRRLMPVERERLQGFPDDWTRWGHNGQEMSDTARERMTGNAVAVPVAEWIGRRLLGVTA